MASNIEGTLHVPRPLFGGRPRLNTPQARARRLEDRMLVLRNKADKLRDKMTKAGFDPGQPRDDHGRWGGALSTVHSAVTMAMSPKIRDAIREVITSPKTRAAISAALSAIMSYVAHSSEPLNDQIVDTHVNNISTHAKITRAMALEQFKTAVENIRKMRRGKSKVEKAEKDSLVELIDQILASLDRLKAKDRKKGK